MSNKLTIVYGGQWGSEGKGDVVAAITRSIPEEDGQIIAVRVGGPNAGHCIEDRLGTVRKVQSIPCSAFVREDVISILGASAVISPDILQREIEWLERVWEGRQNTIIVDPNATVILPYHAYGEHELKDQIGSTGKGVGSATAEKVMRRAPTLKYYLDLIAASANADRSARPFGLQDEVEKDWHKRVSDAMYIRNAVSFLDTVLMLGHQTFVNSHTILEGTQGVLLSLNTSGNYPYVTSRDCTPEALMGQIGISSRSYDETEIVCVLRTFPIRVAGNSGPLPNEISWETLKNETMGYVTDPEVTTVTNRNRRIGRWDRVGAYRSISMTRPTSIALTFLDYEIPAVNVCQNLDQIAQQVPMAIPWLAQRQEDLGVPIKWVGIGAHKTIPIGPGLLDSPKTSRG